MTSRLGAGFQPAGHSAGIGTPANLPGVGIPYEQVTNLVPVRSINPITGDYEVDETRDDRPHLAGDPVEQRVVIALTNRRGSFAFDAERGNDFLNRRKTAADMQKAAETDTAAALAEAVAAGEVEILGVTLLAAPQGWALKQVRWRNLVTRRVVTTTARA